MTEPGELFEPTDGSMSQSVNSGDVEIASEASSVIPLNSTLHGFINRLRKRFLRTELGVAALAGVAGFVAEAANAGAKNIGHGAQVGATFNMETAEEMAVSWVGHDSMVSPINLGGVALGYRPNSSSSFPIGPKLLRLPSSESSSSTSDVTIEGRVVVGGNQNQGYIGDVKTIDIKRYSSKIIGPCTFNGNKLSEVTSSSSGFVNYTCSEGGVSKSERDSYSIAKACASIIAQEDEIGIKISMADCKKSAVNNTHALNSTGDYIAEKLKISPSRYNASGVEEFETTSDPVVNVQHYDGNTSTFALSDNTVNTTVTFTNDHKPGKQIHRIYEEKVAGQTLTHIQNY